ncbi:MAG: sodium:solute symporter family protein [Acidobacteria bacterium]|nr:sodium:solute symporter family protein [Acidobacteriota bacterium]
MTTDTVAVLGILAGYILLTVFIGVYSSRFSRGTMEDYHMGSREFKTIVLFCTVFGANISAVTFIGVPGMAYQVGWIAGPYFTTSWAWLTPLLFYTVGSRSWPLGQRFGYMTVGEVVGGRWKSPGLAVLVTLFLILYTVPYLMTGLRGAGITLEALTKGYIPFWVGALIVSLVVMVYLTLGGMRGAAWVNTLQTAIFIIGGLTIFIVVASVLGGPVQATERVLHEYPELISRAKMSWKLFFSYGFMVGAGVILFPQVFMRLLTGKDPKSLKQIMRIYPVPSLLVMLTMAWLGMWGHAVIPGLAGAQTDFILPTLLARYTPIWMMGILGAAVFSAMMSTMDSQLLSVTTMITRDFLYRTELRHSSEAHMVRISRLIVILLTLAAYILALLNPIGVIKIVEFAFAGFASLVPPTLGALYWKRCTKQAAIWAVLLSQVVLLALTFGWVDERLAFGFLPGLPALVVGILSLVVVTYLTAPPRDRGTEEYFALFAEAGTQR